MKKHINLLYKRQDHAWKQKLFRYFRGLAIIVVVTATVALGLINYLVFSAGQREKNLTHTKEQLLRDLLPLAPLQTKLAFINDKAEFWSNLISTSPNFYDRYYQLIQSVLPVSSSLDSFTISAKREMTASVRFIDINAYYAFMDSVEADQFKNQFSRLDEERTGITNFDSIADHPIVVRLNGLVIAK